MTHQGLAPRVQHGGHPQLSVQPLGVRTEGGQGRPHRLEQQAIDHLGVDLDPAVEGVGQGEHQMIGHRQHRCALAFAPVIGCAVLATRTMPIAAGVIQQGRLPALIAYQGKAAQGGGATLQDVELR